MTFLMIRDCYRSGQMSEKQLTEHLKDELFRRWWEKAE